MKKYLILLALTVNFIIWGAIFCIASVAVENVNQVVNIAQAAVAPSAIDNAYAWLSSNWTIVALVVSEVAALLPTKVNGIVQGIIRMFSGLFSKK